MSYQDLDSRITASIRANVPLYISGPPGIGKTERVERFLELDGYYFPLIPPAVVSGPEDFNGYPYGDQETKTARFYAPSWAMEIVQAHAEGRRVAAVFDELTNASPAVQKASLQVILTRRVGQIQLPHETRMVAMGNPPEASGLYDLDAALANRMAHVKMTASHLDWSEGMVSAFGRKEEMMPAQTAARILVASFVRSMPKVLHAMPSDDSERGKAWPSPRTWEMAARLLGAVPGASLDERVGIVASAVGEGASRDFAQYAKTVNLPDPEDFLKEKRARKFELPDQNDMQFAILHGIVSAVETKPTQKRYEKAVIIMGEASKKVMDLAAACARRLVMAGQATEPQLKVDVPEIVVFYPMLVAAGMMEKK